MKKTNGYKYLSALITVLIICSCTEDFLERKPLALETEETFYSSFERLDMTAVAAYGILCTMDVFDYYYFMGFSSPADDSEVGGENTNDWSQFQNMDRLIHTPNEANVYDNYWGYCYKGIRMCNEFLERSATIKEVDPKTDDALLQQRKAEMKFLRSFFHFQLVQVFGGVPYFETTVDPTMFSTPRNSVAEVLQHLEKDLEEALPYLKEKSELAPDYGRASKGAARALLSKVYIYESSFAKNYPADERFTGCTEKWSDALKYAEEVINSGQYTLIGINGERYNSWRDTENGVGGYRYEFTLDGDNSDESIWEIQNVMDGRGWSLTRGTYYVTYTTCRYYRNPKSSDPGANKVVGGWSFNLPTNYLIEAFGNQDRRETGLHSAELNPLLDPRFITTIGCTDTIIVNGVNYAKPWDTILINDQETGLGWYPMSFTNLPTLTISRKYECSPEEYWDHRTNDNEGPMNLRYIRYADVVLLAAEAALMASDPGKALTYINMVRTRARLSGDTGYPENLSAVSFEDIVHERRLELAMEGARLFDLVRWNLAEKYIDGITLAAYGDGFVLDFVPGKHEFHPLPVKEIQMSNNALQQYPGWR